MGKIDRREKILCWMHESSRSGEFRWMTERSTTLSASVLVTPTLLKAYLMNRSAPSRGDMCHLPASVRVDTSSADLAGLP